jgi:hypothetical protein
MVQNNKDYVMGLTDKIASAGLPTWGASPTTECEEAMSKAEAEDLKFGLRKKYSRQSPPVFVHIKYEGVWTPSAWVRHKDAVRERLKALRHSHNGGAR